MNSDAILRFTLLAACLLGVSCQKKIAGKETPPFRIIATDAGFQAPDNIPAGLRHVIMENRGSMIHEAMLVKLPKGMTPDDYVAAVRKGSLFPEGATDCSGPGLLSPGEHVEMWVPLEEGNYMIGCWIAPSFSGRKIDEGPASAGSSVLLAGCIRNGERRSSRWSRPSCSSRSSSAPAWRRTASD
jgi:hypothetical protein